jgi:hypothetical protein
VTSADILDRTFNTAIGNNGWFDAIVTPPKPGFIVKRWNTGALWVGFFSGEPKEACCDQWYPLALPNL